MMTSPERARIARVCRQQAAFASTPEVHAALIQLAEFYEADPPPPRRSAVGWTPPPSID